MSEHNVFRDGRVHVLSDMCATCVFRPGNLMQLRAGRLRGMIAEAKAGGSGIVCHSTLHRGGEVDNAICRGFWDRHANEVPALRLAQIMEIVEEDEPPTKEVAHEEEAHN